MQIRPPGRANRKHLEGLLKTDSRGRHFVAPRLIMTAPDDHGVEGREKSRQGGDIG